MSLRTYAFYFKIFKSSLFHFLINYMVINLMDKERAKKREDESESE